MQHGTDIKNSSETSSENAKQTNCVSSKIMDDELSSCEELLVVISDADYSSNPLTQNMFNMTKKKQFCDTEIIPCVGEHIWAHSTVLASRCEVLSNAFLCSCTSKYVVHFEEISSSVWQYLLEYIYLGIVKLNPIDLMKFYEAANILDMDNLKEQCKFTLKKQTELGNIKDTNRKTQETQIEPELMKFASGLVDNFEFVSLADEDNSDAVNVTGVTTVTGEQNLINSVECVQVEQTSGQEDNKAVFYMVQGDGDEQQYIIATEDSGVTTLVPASDEGSTHEQNDVQVGPDTTEISTDVASVSHESVSSMIQNEGVNKLSSEKTNVKFPAGINPRSIGRPKSRHSKTVFQCGVCHKTYTSKQSLDRHVGLHNNIYPYTCELCGKSFKTQKYLECHIKRHSDSRMYQCPICGKSFKTSRDANWHKKTVHTNIRPFQCQYCAYSSKTRALLNQHLVSHSAAKQWKCTTCDKTFLRKQHLEQHASRHEGKRQYMCSTCGSEFYTIYACKEHHMRVHQGIKRYECSVCHQQYNEKKSFMKHLQKHSVDLVLKLDGGDIIIEQTVEDSAVVESTVVEELAN